VGGMESGRVECQSSAAGAIWIEPVPTHLHKLSAKGQRHNNMVSSLLSVVAELAARVFDNVLQEEIVSALHSPLH
jgi:hypothetical protein